MLGVFVNILTVIVGSLMGCLIKKGISKRICDAVMTAIGASILCIAVSGIVGFSNALAVILSIVIGCIIGTIINIDSGITTLGNWIQNRFSGNNSDSKIAIGFVNSTLLFCVGAMTVVGSINAGVSGDNSTLYAKALLDLISSTMLAASLGIGVVFSTFSILIYQGSLVLAAGWLAPFLTAGAIADLTCTGSILIMLLSFNLLGISKFKLADFLPSLILAPIISRLLEHINI